MSYGTFNPHPDNNMDYDEILQEIGQFSKWHFVVTFPLMLAMGTAAFGILSFSFTGILRRIKCRDL